MPDDFVLQTGGLQKQFGKVRAVEQVDLAVRRGSIFGFLGPNGSGKTTTIGMILSLIRPTRGEIRLFGERVTPEHNRVLRRVGALVGAPALLPYLSACGNLEMLRYIHPEVSARRVEEVLDQAGLRGAAGRAAGRYSTGMKQRLGLAMALLHQPEMLILDEPTNGMDPAGMREIRCLLRDLAASGMTVFLSSHLLHEVEQICDEVAVLSAGRVVAHDSVRVLLDGRREQIRLRLSSPAEAASLLRTLDGVTAVRPDGAYLIVEGASSEAIIACLASQGIYPGEVTAGGSDLEELFLELTEPPA